MKLRRRIEALESALITEPTILVMPDGSTETLPGSGDYMLDLFTRACCRERTEEMESIARSVSSTEPDGAHMIDLVRVCLNGPSGH
jgi:hypothetical protein